MLGSMSPVCTHAPQVGSESDYRQQKKDARNLKPDNAPYAPKRTEKTADTFGNSSGLNTRPCFAGLNRRVRKVLRLHASGLRRFCQVLSHHSASNTHPNA